MHIALSTDDRYSMACGVCIASIYENHKSDDVHVHVLTSGLSKANVARFMELAAGYGRHIDIIQVKDEYFSGLKLSTRFPVSIYYRLLLPRVLESDRVLYLDCDIIVNGNLRPLYDHSMPDGCPAVVVEDQWSDDMEVKSRAGVTVRYFNSGVMLMNLDCWRRNQIAQKCVEFIHDNPERCVYPDQDALNHVIGNSVIFAEYGYNFQELMYGDRKHLRLDPSKFEMIDKWIGCPAVIHYSGYHKPWYTDTTHPKADVFLDYLRKSPWKNARLRAYFGIIEKLKRRIRRGWRL